jgi:cation transport ATPase
MPNQTLTLDITGMHCNACVRRLTAAFEPLADSVSVSLAPPRAVLTGQAAGAALLARAQAAASAAGNYSVAEVANAPSPLSTTPLIAKKPTAAATSANISWLSTYKPLLIILAYISGVTLAVQWAQGRFVLDEWMRHFMAGFFLVFSFFKLLDVRSFANAYAGYDLLAARWHGWGLLYPFVELALGVAYLLNLYPPAVHTATVLVMGFSSIGVILAVRRKQQIACACLGSVFNLPMSTVTIIEDLAMVAMALWMLLMV